MKKIVLPFIALLLIGCGTNQDNPKSNYNDVVTIMKEYGNQYTDEDYKNAEGEKCLHPRGEYECEEMNVEIWSDPHCLHSYFVTIKNNEESIKIYFDESDYLSIQENLFELGFERIDID